MPTLMNACQFGFLPVVRELLDCGADISQCNVAGDNAVMFAARYGHTAVLKYLLDPNGDGSSGFDLNSELAKPCWTSLHRAAANGYEQTVLAMLHSFEKRRGAEAKRRLIGHQDAKGVTPLMAASSSGHTAMTALLLEHGAQPQHDETGKTALMAAASFGQAYAIGALLKHKLIRESIDELPLPPSSAAGAPRKPVSGWTARPHATCRPTPHRLPILTAAGRDGHGPHGGGPRRPRARGARAARGARLRRQGQRRGGRSDHRGGVGQRGGRAENRPTPFPTAVARHFPLPWHAILTGGWPY